MAYHELLFLECDGCGAVLTEGIDQIPAATATAKTSEHAYLFSSHSLVLKASAAAGWLTTSFGDRCPACRWEYERSVKDT